MQEHYKFEEIAQALSIPLRTFYQLVKDGRGPKTIKIGRHYRVSKIDYEEWLHDRHSK